MPNNCTERKCGHVNTTHVIATAVSSALYKMRRVSQYRRESATERLNSSIPREYEFLQMCVKYFVLQRPTIASSTHLIFGDVASSSTSVASSDLLQMPGQHKSQSMRSLNPRPLKIIGT